MESLGFNPTLLAQLINFIILFGFIAFIVRLVFKLNSLSRSMVKISEEVTAIRKLLEERTKDI